MSSTPTSDGPGERFTRAWFSAEGPADRREQAAADPASSGGEPGRQSVRGRRWLAVAGWPALLVAASAATVAAEPAGDLAGRPWKLEAIELHDGLRLEGLIVAPPAGADETEAVEFLQIVQRPGRRKQLIARPPFPVAFIRFMERLPAADREKLLAKVAAFREGQRRLEEAASVPLTRTNDHAGWRYEGPAFSLESSADSMLTRDAIVRLELIMTAFAALVPPVTEPPPLTVKLCGSMAEYRGLQEKLGVRIENPAFYLPARRLLVAGSELPALIDEQKASADQLDAARQRYESLDKTLEDRLRDLAVDLDRQGFPPARRAEIIRRGRQRWAREQADGIARIEAARRANANTIARARRGFRARLAHEAWHAYAAGALRTPGDAGLPAWLDEGLAQVVESAAVEAGEVRLDAPDAERLERLQRLLAEGGVPPVADLLSAGQAGFLQAHAGGVDETAYLVAWGLAFDLAVSRPVLSVDRIRDLVRVGDDAAIPRFEAIVAMPIDRFDRLWRQRMLELSPRLSLPVTEGP
ncbi:MAG: DUF1570 domain-containing protein [Planctomycetota bacterium]|nr:DUF1570 domain-containing protein [Planctomycetota bacterium]MDA1200633.1 DUF1570 domain-containing protein [Planctomycetota bacterium]